MHKQYPYHYSQWWKWSEDFGCWVSGLNETQHPEMFGLGNKILYWQAGRDTYMSKLRGSTSEHWGGWHFDADLQKGLDWLKE